MEEHNHEQESVFLYCCYDEKGGDIHLDYNVMHPDNHYKNLFKFRNILSDSLYWQGFFDAVEAFNEESNSKISFEMLKKMVEVRIEHCNPENTFITYAKD